MPRYAIEITSTLNVDPPSKYEIDQDTSALALANALKHHCIHDKSEITSIIINDITPLVQQQALDDLRYTLRTKQPPYGTHMAIIRALKTGADVTTICSPSQLQSTIKYLINRYGGE